MIEEDDLFVDFGFETQSEEEFLKEIGESQSDNLTSDNTQKNNEVLIRLEKIENLILEKKELDVDDEVKKRLTELKTIFVAFLVALKKDPENSYIKWPNRVESIDKLLNKVEKLLDGII